MYNHSWTFNGACPDEIQISVCSCLFSQYESINYQLYNYTKLQTMSMEQTQHYNKLICFDTWYSVPSHKTDR